MESDFRFMQCNSPISLPDPKAKGNAVRITVPCGKCYPCLSNRRTEWTFRLLQEQKVSTSAWFITMTYTDENLPIRSIQEEKIIRFSELLETHKIEAFDWNSTLHKKDYQDFMKRLRKKVEEHYKAIGDLYERHGLKIRPIKYYAVGEYGSKTKRPHYHAIMFNVPKEIAVKIADIWKYGNVQTAQVSRASIHYVTKYVTNPDHNPPGREPEFSVISNGIGKEYIEKNADWHRKNNHHYLQEGKHKVKMPRYYQEKTFSRIGRKVNAIKNEYEIARKKSEEFKKANHPDQGEVENEIVKDQYRKLKQIQNKKGKL